MEHQSLSGKKIALLATNGFEDSELEQPLQAAKNAGAIVEIISLEPGTIKGKNGLEISVDKIAKDVSSSDYGGLILPGGLENPDSLRMNEDAVNFVKGFFEKDAQKPVAAICHAPWLLIEADVVMDKNLTSWPSLKTDLMNAGATWSDEEVVVDNGLVTSRNPDDLPAFCAKMIEEFTEGEHEENNQPY